MNDFKHWRDGALPRLINFLAAVMAYGAYAASYTSSAILPPKPAREFRGAWVATVGNIDWPSRKGLSTADQKTELLAILDRAAELKLNVVVFQVRPACDALYASRIEPWSEFLTGTMGQPPQPFYDPLAFAVEEAHKRGLELHAWFNPYRARVGTAGPVAASHVSRTHPELVRQCGRYAWLDPGEKGTQDYSLSVVMDVVNRYDVDGVHFDDYFYPYPERDEAGKETDFPDEASWKRYGARRKLDRADWRRENVNSFIERVYKSIKAAKPWVKFGLSPFGIWRPGNPPQIKGFDAYSSLYADSRLWLTKGWCDYFAPQLYWAIDPPDQSFPVLLKWWAAQNSKGRWLAPGLDTTKSGRGSSATSTNATRRTRGWKTDEIVNQIRLTRNQPSVGGHIHWNMRTLMRNTSLDEVLEREVYAEPALVPASPWLGRAQPGKPKLAVERAENGSQVRISWAANRTEKAWLWLVQTRTGREWTTQILPATLTARVWSGHPPEAVAVSVVSRTGAAGLPAVAQLTSRRN